ncbi:MAG: GNAT family N-acetyltransferase [Acidaminococcales bacterium]|jgi:predicted acetyltransferase|nr:GNAT family N-acetyltransferase [Acidaminococcales bacterium]
MLTRLLKKRELAQAGDLWDYCFEKREDPFFAWYFSSYCRAENVLGAFTGGSLAGMIHLNPYTLLLNRRPIETPYFVGVAVAPQCRGRGVLRALLEAAFKLLRERGQPLAVLMPSAAGLYLPYGFAYCYQRLSYRLPLPEIGRVFPKTAGFDFAFAALPDWPLFREVYDQFTRPFNGCAVRGEREWRAVLGEILYKGAGRAVIAKSAGKVRGYMLYALQESVFRVVELAWLDGEAQAALFGFAGRHFSQCGHFAWLAPAHDLTCLRFSDSRYYPVALPFMMGRVLDPARAVAALELPMPEGEVLRVKLSDGVIPENNGVFMMKARGCKAELSLAAGRPDVAMDIGVFAQLCFGAYAADDLWLSASIQVESARGLEILREVFPARKNYINEYF